MPTFNKIKPCFLTGAILMLGLTAQAQADSYPSISGEVVMELQNEYTADSDDQTTDDYNNLFFRTEVAPTVQFKENIFLDGVLVWENIQDRDPNDDNFIDNEGAFIEELKLNYENGAWAAWVGKFNPAFGIAWDFGRGIWGEDFAEDYEITEKIGVGGSYTFETSNAGSHTLAASTFFADTTFLSGSIVTNRDTLDKDDGGVSNTEDFSSYAVSLEGEDLAGVENLYYKLGYRNQDEGDNTIGGDRETGYIATLGHSFPVSERVEVDALLEYAHINNFEAGTADHQYATASFVTIIDDVWNVAASYTSRDIDDAGTNADDHFAQISAGYDFSQGTTVEIGWRNSEEGNEDTDIIGGLIRHVFEF